MTLETLAWSVLIFGILWAICGSVAVLFMDSGPDIVSGGGLFLAKLFGALAIIALILLVLGTIGLRLSIE